jgi:hypothetical protein
MLRADAVFDISFKQLGQSGFMALSKSIAVIFCGSDGSHARRKKCTAKKCKRPASIWGTVLNGDRVTAAGFPIR